MTLYEKYLTRKDTAVQNAQWNIDRGNVDMAEYWSNQAKFCENMLQRIISMAVDKWIDMEV